MRPKKIVLCADADELALSLRSFLLNTRGYRVYSASTLREAVESSIQFRPLLAIISCDMGDFDGNEVVIAIKDKCPEVRTILISPVGRPGERVHNADAFLGYRFNSPADLVDRVKGMTARPRGPRKAVPGVTQEMVG